MEIVLYIIIAVIGFFLFLQFMFVLSARFRKGKEVSGIKGALGKKIAAGERVLVYFFSQTCSACKPMTPVVDKLQKEYKNVFKVDVRRDGETPHKFGVMGTPATVLVENAQIAAFKMGAKNENQLRKLLQ